MWATLEGLILVCVTCGQHKSETRVLRIGNTEGANFKFELCYVQAAQGDLVGVVSRAGNTDVVDRIKIF